MSINGFNVTVIALAIVCAAAPGVDATEAAIDDVPLLRSIYGSEVMMEDLRSDDTKAIVLVFAGSECPVVQLFLPALAEMCAEYKPQGVAFCAVYPNASETVRGIATHAVDNRIPFPVMLDVGAAMANRFHVDTLSEVVVLDADFELRYRGAISDQFYKGAAKPQATRHYLRDALEHVLNGTPLEQSYVPASGCRISRLSTSSQDETPTFYAQVLPILQTRCQSCHHAGAVGPFSLVDYRDAVAYAEMIEEVVVDRRMPPWHVESPYALKGDPRLSADEIETIVAWVRAGAPAGNESDAPPPLRFDAAAEWSIGQPTFVFELDTPFTVPASGALDYQYFRVPTHFERDAWIRAVEVQAGNPRVVHHIQVHEIPGGRTGPVGALEMLTIYGFGLDAANQVGSYVPGNLEYNAKVFPEDRGVKLAQGSDLIMELHYTPYGREDTDRSRIGLILADSPPEHELKSRCFVKKRGRFLIPAGDPHYEMSQVCYFERDVRIVGIRSHLHSRGKSVRMELVYPQEGERTEPLLIIPLWDFNWQRTYEFQEPLVLRSGTEIHVVAAWDNSCLNPFNPDPSVDVPWGQQTDQEMFTTYILYEELE